MIARILVGLFLVAHGLAHLLHLMPRPEEDQSYPFVPETRWITNVLRLEPGTAKGLAGALAVFTAVAFAVAGCALIVNAAIWQPAAVIASSISVLLMLLFFHPWLLIGIAIDLVIIASVTRWHAPAALFEQYPRAARLPARPPGGTSTPRTSPTGRRGPVAERDDADLRSQVGLT